MMSVNSATIAFGADTVLKGISFSLSGGSLTAVLGENGAGKTSLLGAVAGLVPFRTGVLSFEGGSYANTDPEWISKVAFVSDGNDLFPDLTAMEHFEIARLLRGMDRGEAGRRADELLGLFEFAEEERSRPAAELSSGYRKRLAIALALLAPHRLYVFDEPLNGLDLASLSLFRRLMERLKNTGAAIMVSAHDTGPILDLIDETLLLSEGTAIVRGEADRVAAPADEAPPLGLSWLG